MSQGHTFSESGEPEDEDEDLDEFLVGDMLAVGGNKSVPTGNNSVKKVLTPIEQVWYVLKS